MSETPNQSGTGRSTVAAFVGATGGAGTTRTVVETAAALAADGRSVAVLDAAFATQGLADYVAGRIDPDVTQLLVDTGGSNGGRAADLAAALYEFDAGDVAGEVAVCPAHAPFTRLARAKSPAAAERFESLVGTAAGRFDHVLVDVPPIAANQAVAAVNAADTVAVVAPATPRGTEGVQQCHERLADVGSGASLVVSTRGELETADIAVPATDADDVASAPACLGGGSFGAAIERVAAAVTGQELRKPDDDGGLLGAVGEYVGR
ncbi:AAA family ATPase [Halobellus ruber]|uniref:AAA family ATPase n=1 Tax=Halobellus ruber TaxID=2761102 RepID=A0A7J9SJ41_9EURY|nr:AAA family ATPase [Halobellus ruber]MBB6646945.1 AAA family ATPase [Halobellus ruber]